MRIPIHLLIASPAETIPARAAESLEQGGYDPRWERVGSVQEAQAALEREPWDILLVDDLMPREQISALLDFLRRTETDLPRILLAERCENGQTIPDEEGFLTCIRKDLLAQLVPVVKVELREAASRREHRKIASALRESEERYRLHFESLNDVIYSVNRDFVLTDASPSLRTHLGYLPEELAGKPFSELELLTAASREQALSDIRKVLAGEKVPSAEYVFLAKDGTHRFGEVNNTALIKQGKIIGATAVARDITERKRLEEQLHQSQKMEAIGRLAGGVAHDFNNVLTAITGYTDLLLTHLDPGSESRAFAQEIHKALGQASSLTSQLLAFSRKQMMQPVALDMNQIVSGMQRMLGRLIGEDIELTTVLSPDIGSVRADPGQIEQMILNLALNARDAMPDGGHLTLETSDTLLDETYAQQHLDVRPGRYVMLAVRDTGRGMDPGTLSKIFEPFFTTKHRDRFSGLGLSTVYGIVKQSEGHISVESEPWKGTTFRIYLPRRKDRNEKEEPERAPFPTLKGSETILLVEDDESVRNVVREVLRRNGYNVLEANNPGDAILISEQHTGLIHLMVTDVVMPRMSAPELSERLAPWHPEMKVLYMSGYTDSQIVRQGVLETDLPFLQKPFSPVALLQAVREVLANPKKKQA
jgi:two-component system, cell cycle sensor histidine kinase and response regulator CckA